MEENNLLQLKKVQENNKEYRALVSSSVKTRMARMTSKTPERDEEYEI